MEKNSIRKEISGQLIGQTVHERERKSEVIRQKLLSERFFRDAHVVMFYVSAPEEVDTHRMIDEALKSGKRVVVPYCVKQTRDIIASELRDPASELESGVYGIYQPKKSALREIPLGEIDLVIVPGVAFDQKNGRLGRGKGYYDRFLKKLDPRTLTVGICFDFQYVNTLPSESHDSPVHKVITN